MDQMWTPIVVLALMVGTAVPAAPAAAGKVVFLKGTEVTAANADGSSPVALTSDKVPKQALRWSPSGKRIAYRIAGNKAKNPKTHAVLVVVPAGGGAPVAVPVLSTEADGTFVDGMRFVEDSGWYSDSAVFASGSANPHVAEYRIMDAATGTVTTSYFGFDFATCPAKEMVAYGVEDRADPKAVAFHIEFNGKQVYSTNDQGGIQALRWSDSCDRLAFLEGEGTHIKFVVLNGTRLEAKIDLRGITAGLSMSVFQNQFLLPEYLGGSVYNPATRTVKKAVALMDQVKKRKAMHQSLLERLGGRSADWWEPAHE
jgi:hypothetical protein